MHPVVNTNELVLVQGMAATKQTLAEWNRAPWATVRVWLGWSLLTALGLLVAVYVVAFFAFPDPTRLVIPGVYGGADFGDVGRVLLRNSLVLALHRSEEHTSELQSQSNLVCRLLLEKKK